MTRILILGGFGMLGIDMFEALSDQQSVISNQIENKKRREDGTAPLRPNSMIEDNRDVTFTNDQESRKEESDKGGRGDFLILRTDSKNLDITNHQALTDAFEQHRPDWVINCAAYTAVDQAEDEPEKAMGINGYALEKIACAAKKIGAKVIHFSTDYVFDGAEARGYHEDAPKNPLSVYGKSKSLGEDLLLKTYPEGSFIIRTSWLYGKNGKNFVHAMLKLAKERDELRIVNDQRGSPTWTRHLALAVRDDFILPKQKTKNKNLSRTPIREQTDSNAPLSPSITQGENWKQGHQNSTEHEKLERIRGVGEISTNYQLPTTNSTPGIYHLPNSLSCTWYEFACEIVKERKLETKVTPISTAEYPTKAARPRNSILLNTKLPPLPSWKDALKEYLTNTTI